jgi:hypothetical protein
MLGEDILGRSISNAAVRIHVARCTMFSVATRKLIESQSASLCQMLKGIVCFKVQVVWVWVIWRAVEKVWSQRLTRDSEQRQLSKRNNI